jgi:23S rRNA (uracil1939-C5)-methyltransferase
MTGNLITVKLEKPTYGGAALGYLSDPLTGTNGRAVFIPFALPGETVRARVVEEKRGHLRAELIEVLIPSPSRITPKCKHFGQCGGCHYQVLPYAAQLETKTEILRDQLVRIGKIENPPVESAIPSPGEWNYRNHVQFHLNQEGRLGFISVGGAGVIPIEECHLPEPPLNELWPQLSFDPGLGLERISLRLGAEGETMLILESEETPELELEADISVVHVRGGETVVMAGEDFITIKVEAAAPLPAQKIFRVSAASFFQVNTPLAGKMVEHLLASLPLSDKNTVLDVYCGVGLFSAFLAPRAGRVIGVESSPSACEDYVHNLDEFDHVELYEGTAEDILPGLVGQISNLSCAVIDPPRAGMEVRALDALLALAPAKIAYISCDPSTLARDARRLVNGGYCLVRVTPFDLFPQTHSIESISTFEKI